MQQCIFHADHIFCILFCLFLKMFLNQSFRPESMLILSFEERGRKSKIKQCQHLHTVNKAFLINQLLKIWLRLYSSSVLGLLFNFFIWLVSLKPISFFNKNHLLSAASCGGVNQLYAIVVLMKCARQTLFT